MQASMSSMPSSPPDGPACFWRTFPDAGRMPGMNPEIEAFAAHLARVERASAHTQRAYVSDLRQLAAFLDERGISLDAATRDDLRAFLDSRYSATHRPRWRASSRACGRSTSTACAWVTSQTAR